MDYGGDFGQIIPETRGIGGGGGDNWIPGLGDQAIWATEEDYGAWTGDASADTPSNSNYDGRQSQTRSGSEPPNKKSRGDSQGSGLSRDRDRSKAIGKMFFKTKLCCKFRAGTCPYITNCNFAHGIEELRKPPPNWQEIVAAQEEERGVSSEPREEHQIPTIVSVGSGETQRSYKGRHCKKFYTDEGCPYGDNCTFLHDEQSKARESVAISLGPTVGSGYGNNGNGANQKPSNWKTRICNKWEMTGYCPFGSKCHFAHGLSELHRYGGGLVDTEGRDSTAPPDSKQVGLSSKIQTDTAVAASITHSDVYHMAVPSQRSLALSQRQGQRPLQKWKGPDKISRIYGDWIDDYEGEPAR
ncbi:zinc finger CCCH domain-containing protein 56-like [Macadamia integrifolia]|uniref:zinc finger CCCH domain-containing protein 56-like n=1 Tax=Macadamia integrifolia TaxID=60698 RepID=UPI001C4E843A|nr:zinc finger CCCH domain-containing protein 56-like [Macadamia integrifolia]